MFQFLKENKVKKLSKTLGLDIDYVSVRGDTNHCKYIILKDGRECWLVKDVGLIYIKRNLDGTMAYSLNEHIRRQFGEEVLQNRLTK